MRKLFLNARFALAIFLLAAAFSGCASTPPPLRFVVLGDTQFHNADTLDRMVEQVALLEPEFVLHVGDMIHGYHANPTKAGHEWARFQRQIAPLQAPFYPTPGNHDLTTPALREPYRQAWGRKKFYYSFNYGISHFIVLDQFDAEKHYTLSEEQRRWLERDLERNKNARHIFISHHAPLQYDNPPGELFTQLHELYRRYPVRAVFTGHNHIYDWRVIDGITYFCLNTSGDILSKSHWIGRSHMALLVTADKDHVRYAALTEEGLSPFDAVPAGEVSRASPWAETDKTLRIPDPARAPLAAAITVPVANRAEAERSIALRWEIRDLRWSVEPPGADFLAGPKESRDFKFEIRAPQGPFHPATAPRLRCESPYLDANGNTRLLTWYYNLLVPREARAARMKSASWTFDGKTDDAAWRAAPSIGGLQVDLAGAPAPETTEVKILYDDEAVYFGVWGEDPNAKTLIAKAEGELPLVFGDDDFEFFLDVDNDSGDYHRIMANSKGVKFCSSPEGLFKFDYEVKTHVGSGFWSAEFRVPFEQLKVAPPAPGDSWGLNFRRHLQQYYPEDGPGARETDPTQRDWVRMRVNPPELYKFGVLTFE